MVSSFLIYARYSSYDNGPTHCMVYVCLMSSIFSCVLFHIVPCSIKKFPFSCENTERETSFYDFGVVVDEPCPEPPFFLLFAFSCFATRKNSTFFNRRKSGAGVKRICVFEIHSAGLKSSSLLTAFEVKVGRKVPSGPLSTM